MVLFQKVLVLPAKTVGGIIYKIVGAARINCAKNAVGATSKLLFSKKRCSSRSFHNVLKLGQQQSILVQKNATIAFREKQRVSSKHYYLFILFIRCSPKVDVSFMRGSRSVPWKNFGAPPGRPPTTTPHRTIIVYKWLHADFNFRCGDEHKSETSFIYWVDDKNDNKKASVKR